MLGRGSLVDTIEFSGVVIREFPQLKQEFDYWGDDDLLHLQMMEFLKFTQNEIASRSFDVVRKCFEIAATGLKNGDDALRNAIYVSFLEGLDLRSDEGREAYTLMPDELKKGRDEILDYNQRLLGRKWSTDE